MSNDIMKIGQIKEIDDIEYVYYGFNSFLPYKCTCGGIIELVETVTIKKEYDFTTNEFEQVDKDIDDVIYECSNCYTEYEPIFGEVEI